MTAARSAPPVDLSMLLNQSSYALSNRLSAALAEAEVSLRVYCVLIKAVGEERTQAELAEAAFLDKTTMVVTLDEMEAAGLAERRASPGDRRVRRIHVTPAGEARLHAADAVVRRVYDEVLAGVPEADRATFIGVLAGLVDGPLAAPFHMERPVRRRAQRAR